MDQQELQKLRDLPIEGVAERLGLRVSHHKSLCPFHADKHPSLSYNSRKNTCRCFVCMNESIGTIDLVMRFLHLDFKYACRWLANENNTILTEYKPEPLAGTVKPFDASRYARFFERPWVSKQAMDFLYGERMIDPRVVRWCKLTSWTDRQGVNLLQIPYYDMENRLVGIQNRNLDYKKDSPAEGGLVEAKRFRFPSGSKCSIYNLPVLKRLQPGDELWIGEGCSDCWSMLSAGHKAIAIPSATLLKPEDKELFESLKPLDLTYIMAADADEPGERLFAQLKCMLPNLIRYDLAPGCKDYSEQYVSMKRKETSV